MSRPVGWCTRAQEVRKSRRVGVWSRKRQKSVSIPQSVCLQTADGGHRPLNVDKDSGWWTVPDRLSLGWDWRRGRTRQVRKAAMFSQMQNSSNMDLGR